MKVDDLFFVYNGSKLDFEKQVQDDAGINFVSRNSNNNGVVGRVAVDTTVKIYRAGDITVPLGGSYLLSCFVQDEDFVTAQNVAVLRAKVHMSTLEKWFYCYALRENRFKFSAFGREVNKYIKDIELPESVPAWVSNGNIDNIPTDNNANATPLKISEWVDFSITQLFNTTRGKMGSVTECDIGDTPLVSAYTQNNGVSNYISCSDEYVNNGNCLTVANTGQGSVFRTFYQPTKFVPSNNVTCLTAKNFNMNKYIGLFITTLCRLEIPRYSYGRIVNNKRLEQTVLKLPAIKDEKGKFAPDWSFMEQYIKSLPYGDRL